MEPIAIQKSTAAAEMLRKEMIAAGDRLVLALRVEAQFGDLNPGEEEVIRRQWIECRAFVEQFAGDYAVAINKWRRAVQECAAMSPVYRSGRRGSSSFFQQLLEDGIQRVGLHR